MKRRQTAQLPLGDEVRIGSRTAADPTPYEERSDREIGQGGDVQALDRDGNRVATPAVTLLDAFPQLRGVIAGQRR